MKKSVIIVVSLVVIVVASLASVCMAVKGGLLMVESRPTVTITAVEEKLADANGNIVKDFNNDENVEFVEEENKADVKNLISDTGFKIKTVVLVRRNFRRC